MIIYVPREITSTEDAEQLPGNAVVINDDGDRYNLTLAGRWHSASADRDLSEDLVGRIFRTKITALTPIEVEVEHIRATNGRTKTLYVTPWADADSHTAAWETRGGGQE